MLIMQTFYILNLVAIPEWKLLKQIICNLYVCMYVCMYMCMCVAYVIIFLIMEKICYNWSAKKLRADVE